MPVRNLKDALESLKQDLGVDTVVLAGAFQVHPRAIDRWTNGESYPQHEARARLEALDRLRDHVCETFNSADAIHTWMHTDNRYLGGLTPANALLAGRIDRVEATLDVLDSGLFI